MNNRVVKNASWIIVCKIAQSLLSFVIGLFTARYLGPSNFGLISYAASIVAFFLPIMQLGFKSTLVQEFLDSPEEEGKALGTSLIFSIASALACVVGVVSFSFVANHDEPETILVCFLYSLTLVFQASEMTQYWFQAKLLSKYPSIVSLVAYGAISAYKIYILAVGKSITWFAVTHVIEAFLVSALLIGIYLKRGQKLSFSFSFGMKMLSRSKHYISAGLIVVIFQQTDRIMLKSMIGEAETGFYSAAFTCVGITGFFFSAVIDSMRPYILEVKERSHKLFEERMTLLFSIVSFLSLAQGLVMTVFSKIIVGVLFGSEFAPTVLVLQILVWQVMFGHFGTVRNIWILAQGQQKYLWRINLLGAILNVGGNAILIPLMGASGAALASVATQVFTNFFLCFAIKPMRPVGKIIVKSFNPKILAKALVTLKNR